MAAPMERHVKLELRADIRLFRRVCATPKASLTQLVLNETLKELII